MLYRKHSDAVTINSRRGHSIMDIIAGKNEYVIDEKHYKTVMKFSKIYANYIPINHRNSISEYLSLPEKTFMKRCESIYKNKFSIRNSVITLLCKVIIRPFCSPDLSK